MISAKNSIFEIGEIFNYEFKKLNETIMSLNLMNGKKTVQYSIEENVKKIINLVEMLFSKYNTDLNCFAKEKDHEIHILKQEIKETREAEVYKLNSNERKKTKHKLKRMNLKKEIEKLTKSLEEKNEELLTHIHNFHTTLKNQEHYTKKINLWYQRQLKKIELAIIEKNDPMLNQLIYKVRKYQLKIPWRKEETEEGDSPKFSILTTPFSNYSFISSDNDMSKSKTMNKAFVVSNDKESSLLSHSHLNFDLQETNGNLDNISVCDLFEKMDGNKLTATENENILLKLLKNNENNTSQTDIPRNTVELEEILNAKGAVNNNDCNNSDPFDLELAQNKRKSVHSMENLLSSKNFTLNLNNNNNTFNNNTKPLSPIFVSNNIEEVFGDDNTSSSSIKKIRRNLNKEIYESLADTLDLGSSQKKVINPNIRNSIENKENRLPSNIPSSKESFLKKEANSKNKNNNTNSSFNKTENTSFSKTINFQNSDASSQFAKKETDLLKSDTLNNLSNNQHMINKLSIPKLNLEKVIIKEEMLLSCSPSYRKKAERRGLQTNYIDFSNNKSNSDSEEKFKIKRIRNNIKANNKSVDLSHENRNRVNFSDNNIINNNMQMRIKEKASKFINNICPRQFVSGILKKHKKSNYSFYEENNNNKTNANISYANANESIKLKKNDLSKDVNENQENEAFKKNCKKKMTNLFNNHKLSNLLSNPNIPKNKPFKVLQIDTKNLNSSIESSSVDVSSNNDKKELINNSSNFLNIIAPANNINFYISKEYHNTKETDDASNFPNKERKNKNEFRMNIPENFSNNNNEKENLKNNNETLKRNKLSKKIEQKILKQNFYTPNNGSSSLNALFKK